jgi:hypothetical protein
MDGVFMSAYLVKDWDEIEKAIKGLEPEAAAVLAARCALRVLPLAIRPNVFSNVTPYQWWGIEVFAMGPAALLDEAAIESVNTVIATARNFALKIFNFSAGDALATISNAMKPSIGLRGDSRSVIGAAIATVNGAKSAVGNDVSSVLTNVVWADCQLLAGGNPIYDCLNRPLWWGKQSESWDQLLSDWQEGLKNKNPELAPIAERHMRMVEGKFDWAEAESVVREWAEADETVSQDETVKIDPAKSNAGGGFITVTSSIPDEYAGAAITQADTPGASDRLGRTPLVTAMAEIFADPNQGTPITIGLFGNWGAGKTTVMGLLKKRLMSQHKMGFCFATLNAWSYEHTNNLAAGLAQETVKGLTKGLSRWEQWRLRLNFGWNEHRSALYGLAGTAFLGLVTVIGVAVGATSGAVPKTGTVLAAGTAWVGLLVVMASRLKAVLDHPLAVEVRSYFRLPKYGEYLGLVPVLQRHVRTLCDLRLRPKPVIDPQTDLENKPETALVLNRFFNLGPWLAHIFGVAKPEAHPEFPRRLIVFIDDLDRCEPETIVKTFEAVRLVMDIPNVIVILAVDQRIALKAVGRHFAKLGGDHRAAEDIARDYLGKIIQIPICLSDPTDDELTGFIDKELFADAQAEEKTDKEGGDEGAAQPRSDSTKPKPHSHLILGKPGFGPDGRDGLILADPSRPFEVEPTPDKPLQTPMRETANEVLRFKELTQASGFANPRQLRRLRNSYRLLRRLYGDDYKWEQLMTALFWEEFLHQWPHSVHRACEAKAEGLDVEIPLDKLSRDDRKVFEQRFDATLGFVNRYFQDLADYGPIGDSVRRLVLPRAEEKEPTDGGPKGE